MYEGLYVFNGDVDNESDEVIEAQVARNQQT